MTPLVLVFLVNPAFTHTISLKHVDSKTCNKQNCDVGSCGVGVEETHTLSLSAIFTIK